MRDVSTWNPRCSPPSGLVRPVQLDPAGVSGPTRGQARSRRWRRSGYGFYVPSHVDGSVPEQRILEAAVHLPPEGAITGWAGCRWLGAGYFDGLGPDGSTQLPVPLACGPRNRPQPGPRMHPMRDRLDPEEVRVVRGVRCASPERSLFDAMRHADGVREAVVAMDMMAAAELTSIRRMRAYCAGRAGWNGLPQTLQALDLADEDSRSPAESRMRLVWVLDAGFPPPLLNRPVFDLQGRFIGLPDMLDPLAGLVGEYDGAAHRGGRRHHRDVVREELFRGVGLDYFKVVGRDTPADALGRMRSARARAFTLPRERWAWSLEVPDGWYDDPLDALSLDERLEYREWLEQVRRSEQGR